MVNSYILLVCFVLTLLLHYGILSKSRNAESFHSYLNNEKGKGTSNKNEETSDYWTHQAQFTLNEKLSNPPLTGVAKNVILFIGDGMSISTLAAARKYLGQQNGKPGEETRLSLEHFSYSGLSKTYCVNKQVADSACSATAYLCGVKSNEATLGVTAAVKLGDCDAMQNLTNHVYSIAHWSQIKGKRTGIVTTTAVTDASPAGVYAHSAHRDWQNDDDVKKAGYDPDNCPDIASQLIHGETGRNLNVILGGGRGQFIPTTFEDEEGEIGYRTDDRNLIEEWKTLKPNASFLYIYNKTSLLDVPIDTEYLLGLFHKGDMQFNLDRDFSKKPSLQEMTEVAIKLLSKDKNGYFLFVEGGLIDHAHHGTHARKALDETVELHKAIETALKMTNVKETLIVVTSDHSHTMTISGYPSRGNDILGIGGTAIDSLPYATLNYANGPGYRQEENGKRHDITEDDLDDKDYQYPALVPLNSETHAGEDVGIFACGPWSHLLSGTVEQNFIPHVMAYASCVGNGRTVCN